MRRIDERVVLDTNVVVSSFLRRRSPPGRVVEAILASHQPVVTEATWTELKAVLRRPKLDRYVSIAVREEFLQQFALVAIEVPVTERIKACADPKDDKFLEAAVSGDASAIVTGDRALLALHPFQSVEIVTPADYLCRLGLSP